MMKKMIAVPLVAIALLTGCAEGTANKQTFGTVIGAGLGALVGAQFGSGKGQILAAVVGGLAGAYAGSEIGKVLDANDRDMAQQTAQLALETNKTGYASSWQNPDSGHSGSATPTSTYQQGGKDCREFETTVNVDSKSET
ncbi:MAG TPA: glycine zipper 2TM domain-containing protein, partial [Rhodospirillales bacterium]|nr:glycine zipper 2TM domain-containing protein [Rhodospirillales bacterium]